MFGTLMLDREGDLVDAFETIGALTYDTIGVALGSQQVSQACSLRVSTKTRDVWFNLSAGIDMTGLFFDTNRADSVMNPIRAQAFRATLEATPGFGRYAEGKNVTFTRTGKKIATRLPCIVIDCDNSRVTPSVIG